MRKNLLLSTIILMAFLDSAAQVEYKVITAVESLVTSGVGRSRIIDTDEKKNHEDYTTVRTDDKKSDNKNKSDRGEIRIKNYEETKLLNFYNITGIRFQNIAANDAVISSKLTSMLKDGWELLFVTSAVESDAGGDDGQGIFITRYIFKKE